MTTFQIAATYNHFRGPSVPQGIQITARPATREEAAEIAATFPKALGLKASYVTGGSTESGWLQLHVKLTSDGVNDGVNETGMARYRKFLVKAAALGHTVEWSTPFSNSYMTEAEFEAAVAA